MQPNIIGIRFSRVGKIYHFDASQVNVQVGDHVVVETSRGRQLGEVIQFIKDPVPPSEGGWKSVERKATPADLVQRQHWQQKQTAAMIDCRARAAEIKLEGIKIVAAEYSYDGTRLTFMFSSENEEKAELKSLRKDMARQFPEAVVEFRQIGPRDVAKILGGMGACGIETRCCSKFLTDFSPISIKMAKEQGISLTPTEITGMCGRLRCCLIYEYEQYVAARKELPKRNKRVITPDGEGKVMDLFPLRNAVLVLFETETNRSVKEYHKDVLEPWDELEALRRKAEGPCDRHENGGCDCGKDKKPATPPASTEKDDADPDWLKE